MKIKNSQVVTVKKYLTGKYKDQYDWPLGKPQEEIRAGCGLFRKKYFNVLLTSFCFRKQLKENYSKFALRPSLKGNPNDTFNCSLYRL